MSVLEVLAGALLVAGVFFYLAGTVGLLRFPDALSRLHALTKADNAGLLLVCLGLGLLSGSALVAALLLLVWLLALLAATVSAHLIARGALSSERARKSAQGEER
jgi:multicomponent Na+:H+ antiporter subunit G